MDKKMLLFLAIFLLAASVVGYMVLRAMPNQSFQGNTSQTALAPTITPTLIPYPTKGEFTLIASTLKGTVNKPFTMRLVATSTDTVAGYDVVLTYDKTAFDTQAVQNLADAFRIFPYDKLPDHMSISGTKDLKVTTPVQFSQTPLIQFTFLPKKSGIYTFSLKAVGAESSKMVNESAQVTYPTLHDVRLEIQ